MSTQTLRSVKSQTNSSNSKGKQDVLEEKLDVEHGLLSKLEATRQPHVVRMLCDEGLHTYGVLLIIHCAAIVCSRSLLH